jgi:hypothetical protein
MLLVMVLKTPSRSDLPPVTTPPSGPEFDRLCVTASDFWQRVAPPSPGAEKVILVDLKCQDLRVALRTLTFAQALRRVVPAELVGVVGLDPDWPRLVWNSHDPAALEKMGRAYGVTALVDHNADPATLDVLAGGRQLRVPEDEVEDDGWLATTVDATAARLLFIPHVTDEVRASESYAGVAGRARPIARINAGMLASWDVAAVVTTHVDYTDWGLLVHQATRADVPVFAVQSTGGMKVYATWGDSPEARQSVRTASTLAVADEFERHLWPQRDVLRRSAELTAYRAKHNLGRPPWWRGGADSDLQLGSAGERAALRRITAGGLDWDPEKPVIGVFNHAVSDALGTNVEAFDDLAQWFEQTVEHAAEHDEVNWLLVDHPAQWLYDDTGVVAALAARFPLPHLHFTRTMAMTKNALWSLVDLAVTVRGSVSNEFPAFGIPALQAGWSDWSSVGFTRVAGTRDDYWRQLDEMIAALLDGKELIDDEQVERARLWMWSYRAGTDLVSPLLPHWSVKDTPELCTTVERSMRQVDIDGDPIFAAVRRMWLRREPWLSRWDFRDAERFADALAPSVTPVPAGPPPGGWLSTAFDTPIRALELPGILHRGKHDPHIVWAGQMHLRPKILGRITGPNSTVSFRVADEGRPVVVTVRLALDRDADEIRARRVVDEQAGAPARRTLHLWCQNRLRGSVVLDPSEPSNVDPPTAPRRGARHTIARLLGRSPAALPANNPDGVLCWDGEFRHEPEELGDDGIVVLELRDGDPEQSSTIGVRVAWIKVRHA